MKSLKLLFLPVLQLLILLAPFSETSAGTQDPRVLMVVSSHGEQQGQAQPGYEFDEFAKAYLVFKANGIDIDIASPNGGLVEADKYDATKSYNALVLEDKAVMTKLGDTLKTASVNALDYNGVFVVGGKGAMFDLPKDQALKALIAEVYQQQGSVAAVCHGPAALVDVTLADGSYLVANKAVNSFTNEEERLFGAKWIDDYEFLLEDKLIERGARFQSSRIMLGHVAVDDRLITGQNPSSTVLVATQLVQSMGLKPVYFEGFSDDRTLSMVAKVVSGDIEALQILKEHQAEYEIELVGMYGVFYLKAAKVDADFETALALMMVAQDKINNPRLDLAIAKAQKKLGDEKSAKETLDAILSSNPEFQPAKDVLNTLSI